MLNSQKRRFLLQTTAITTLSLIGSLNTVFAEWQRSLFEHQGLDDLVNSLTNNNEPSVSEDIHIKAPEIAENGAVVPITVNTTISDVTNISLIVDNNPSPLTSSFTLNPELQAYVSTRVKMAESSNIVAIVATKDNQYYTASKSIKVTIGGCGG